MMHLQSYRESNNNVEIRGMCELFSVGLLWEWVHWCLLRQILSKASHGAHAAKRVEVEYVVDLLNLNLKLSYATCNRATPVCILDFTGMETSWTPALGALFVCASVYPRS